MAVPSSSYPKQKLPHQKGKISNSDMKKVEKSSRKKPDGGCSPPAKRRKCPEVRVIGGRIYDSENGKTCHQCRQKTMDFVAACKNQKKDKPCTIMFCHKCLNNRYGEKAEEMAVLENWNCPKCRGICNCSLCMKRRGHQPTGILVHTARATGFSSVSELLHVKGPENGGNDKIVQDMDTAPTAIKDAASENDPATVLPIKQGKRSSSAKQTKLKRGVLMEMQDCVNSDANHDDDVLLMETNRRMTRSSHKKLKRTQVKSQDNGELSKEATAATPGKPQIAKKGLKNTQHERQVKEMPCVQASIKMPQISNGVSRREVKISQMVGAPEKEKKLGVLKGLSSKTIECESKKQSESIPLKDFSTLESQNLDKDGAHLVIVVDCHKDQTHSIECQNKDTNADIVIPKGTEFNTVAGIDLSPKDVGHAFQFLEFCSAFGKILNLKKGEPEFILRELITGGRARRGKCSAVAQFHIQLVSLLQKELGENSTLEASGNCRTSWLHALKDCASRSQCVLEKLKLKQLGNEADNYDSFTTSEKLRILNFICDELLCTEKLRSWIDDQNSKHSEKVKEAKERVQAAKQKQKQLKQKMQDEVAKAIISKNGAPLSISEHDAIVSHIKTVAALAHAEMLEAKGAVPNEIQRSDTVRTQPIILDADGRTYWRLKGHSKEPNIILQDVGTWDAVGSGEKWFTYSVEEEKEINKYISSLRKRRLWSQVTDRPSSRTRTADSIE